MRRPTGERGGVDAWEPIRQRLAEAAQAMRRTAKPSRREAARVLEERARALAERPARAEAFGEALDLLAFSLDGERLALDLRYVRAVGRTPDLTPLPGAPTVLLGVASFRGEVVAVFDIHPAPATADGRPYTLFLGRDVIEMAIVADSVDEVARLPVTAVVPRPWRPQPGAGPRGGVTAEGLSVIDGDALLADERFMVGEIGMEPGGSGGDR